MDDAVQVLVNALETYRGRDRLVRTLCYGCQMVGGLLIQKGEDKAETGESLLAISSQLSHCRTVLRLFDDLSMFVYSKQYGLGAQEEDHAVRWLSVLNNVADQLYYPCEHVAWAADAQVIHTKSDKWWLYSTALWGISLLLGILRSLRILVLLNRSWNDSCKNKQPGESFKPCRKELRSQVQSEVLKIVSSLADLTNAIHWMPPGFLWAGKFPPWLVGLMGTVSSLIGIYEMAAGGSSGNV